jgi:hypothetical protein
VISLKLFQVLEVRIGFGEYRNLIPSMGMCKLKFFIKPESANDANETFLIPVKAPPPLGMLLLVNPCTLGVESKAILLTSQLI